MPKIQKFSEAQKRKLLIFLDRYTNNSYRCSYLNRNTSGWSDAVKAELPEFAKDNPELFMAFLGEVIEPLRKFFVFGDPADSPEKTEGDGTSSDATGGKPPDADGGTMGEDKAGQPDDSSPPKG
jgi:hypothetical protein